METKQISELVKKQCGRNYSFIQDFSQILAYNINAYDGDGGTIKEWFDNYNKGGLTNGFIPQFIYNDDIYQIFEKHYKDLFNWLDDCQTETGEEFSLIELNDGGYMPINICKWAFDLLVNAVFGEIDNF